jgi:hypothetical protein
LWELVDLKAVDRVGWYFWNCFLNKESVGQIETLMNCYAQLHKNFKGNLLSKRWRVWMDGSQLWKMKFTSFYHCSC